MARTRACTRSRSSSLRSTMSSRHCAGWRSRRTARPRPRHSRLRALSAQKLEELLAAYRYSHDDVHEHAYQAEMPGRRPHGGALGRGPWPQRGRAGAQNQVRRPPSMPPPSHSPASTVLAPHLMKPRDPHPPAGALLPARRRPSCRKSIAGLWARGALARLILRDFVVLTTTKCHTPLRLSRPCCLPPACRSTDTS